MIYCIYTTYTNDTLYIYDIYIYIYIHTHTLDRTCQFSHPLHFHPTIPFQRTAWFRCRSSPRSARRSAPGRASWRPWPARCWPRAAWTPCSAWPRHLRRAPSSGWSRGPSWREPWRRWKMAKDHHFLDVLEIFFFFFDLFDGFFQHFLTKPRFQRDFSMDFRGVPSAMLDCWYWI